MRITGKKLDYELTFDKHPPIQLRPHEKYRARDDGGLWHWERQSS